MAHWKFQGKKGVLKAKILNLFKNLQNWNFQWGVVGPNQKTVHGRGMDIFEKKKKKSDRVQMFKVLKFYCDQLKFGKNVLLS